MGQDHRDLPARLCVVLWLAAACASLAHAGPASLVSLAEDRCQPLAGSPLLAALPGSWQPYVPQAKVCPLNLRRGAATQVWLASIWADDYLAANPGVQAWPDFPRPRLVDAQGHCLAVLPELYPVDEPRALRLSFERSADGYPRTIQVRVSNPAQGGDYRWAPLRWDAALHRYGATQDTPEHQKDAFACPT